MAVKRTRNKPVKSTNKVSTRKIFKQSANESLSIKNYNLSSLDGLESIDSFENVTQLAAAAMVMIALLCQLRCLRPDGNASKLDQLPSFRFYKKKITLGTPGQALATGLASSLDEAIVLLPDDPKELESFMIAVLDCYSGNEKFIEKASSSNLAEFIAGHMSRILGIINSCPSANMGAFNIDSSCVSWSISDVLERLPGNHLNKVGPEVVKDIIIRECNVNADSPISFPEPPFLGNLSVENGSKLEKEIFGEFMPSRNLSITPQKEAKAMSSDITEEMASKHLTPLELRKYKSALKISQKEAINRYETIIHKRIKSQLETQNPD
jgi:hypothetical protein